MSAAVPRRQAETTPVTIPNTIEKNVPSATIGTVFLIGSQSTERTGSSRAERAPHVPVREVAEVEPVLLPLRLVEPELAPLVRP